MKPLPQRWLRQAERDFQAGQLSFRAGHCDWACFQAQQSAEKALKALLYHHGRTSVVSHSIVDLIERAANYAEELTDMIAEAKYLDSFYLPTRYPNTLNSEKAPTDYYGPEEGKRCLSSAESILTAVKSTIPR